MSHATSHATICADCALELAADIHECPYCGSTSRLGVWGLYDTEAFGLASHVAIKVVYCSNLFEAGRDAADYPGSVIPRRQTVAPGTVGHRVGVWWAPRHNRVVAT